MPILKSNSQYIHLNFYYYKQEMQLIHVFAFVTLLILTQPQSNICYANCKQGWCALTNALACTDCDLGLLNINNRCVPSNIQPNPLRYFMPNSINTLIDNSNQSLASCNVNVPSIGTTKMIFRSVIGNSLTQQFTIPSQHSYIRLKFNAIIMTNTPQGQSLTMLINIVPSSNLRNFILSETATITSAGVSLSCNSTLSNVNNFYGVFFLDYQVQSSDVDIVVQVIPQGLTNAFLAVSNIELYFGSCQQTCGTCTGPTSAQCKSCRGLLTTLVGGVCSNCPSSFYQNVTCMPCPSTCQSCTLSNRIVVCTSCIRFNSTQFTLVNGSCQTKQYYLQTLNNGERSFNQGWISSRVIFNPLTSCGYYQILGGISIGTADSYFTYTAIELPVHYNIFLRYNLLLIDQTPQDNYQYQIAVDNTSTVRSFSIPTSALTNQCGGQQVQYLSQERVQFVHSASSAVIKISVLKNYMGIRDFILIVNNPTSDPNCLVFLNNQCSSCRNSLIVQNQTCSACLDGFYLKTIDNTLECLECPQTCLTCRYDTSSSKPVCTSCREPMLLQDIYCVDINSNLYSSELLDSIPLSEQPIAWSYYPPLQKKGVDTCNDTEIIGTTVIRSKFLEMRRSYSGLPPHTGVIVYFTLYQIDQNYLANNSLTFTLGSQKYTVENVTNLTSYSILQTELCGNSSLDSSFVVRLNDSNHKDSTLDLKINLNRPGKIGINNLQLYLLNNNLQTSPPFEVQITPAYSVNNPPQKGLQVKLNFPQQFRHLQDINSAFTFNIKRSSNSRLLQQGFSNDLIVTNASNNNKELYYLLNLTEDYNSDYELVIRAASQNSVVFTAPNGQLQPIRLQPVSTTITRYINIDNQDVNDRSSLRNLYNLFRGCAILSLFIGVGSFLVGMSSAFDDFFILCQLIFVHIFIQMDYNPPSLRVPFAGLHIVQFLEWLPSGARTAIEDAILPDNLYQYTPLAFQQYFQDVAFARMIYHTILYFALIFSLWLVMHVILLIYQSQNPSKNIKYENFFIYYYKLYDSKGFVFVDKIIRFAYFTIAWACFLQFISFSNQPQGFHIWNSILTVLMFIALLIYPIVMFLILRSNANSLSDATFYNAYEEIRIDKDKLYYYLIRYYKLVLIALVIAVSYKSSPAIPLVILIVIHIADLGLLIGLKPLGMVQPEVINAYLFYPEYPKVYQMTTIIQEILFILMEIFFLILVGIRNSGSTTAYMGLGYTICVFVILLLLNGLIKLVWGVIKFIQYCYLQREANYLSIQKEMQDKQHNEEQPILPTDIRSQQQMSKRDLTSKLFNTKKMSYVSKIR